MKKKLQLNPEELFQLCSEEIKEDLSTDTRKHHIVFLRAIYFQLCREYVPVPLYEKAAKLVNRNRSTTYASKKIFINDIVNNLYYFRYYTKIKDRIINRCLNDLQYAN